MSTVAGLLIQEISASERGRGAVITAERETEIVAECYRLLSSGVKQKQIAATLKASRSRVSRWCVRAVEVHGSQQDARLVNNSAETLAQFLWARIDVRGANECWPWLGHVKDNGYGGFNWKGKAGQAHRATFECLIARPPSDRVIDHLCSNKRRCNPRHLQAVPQSVNLTLAVSRQNAGGSDAS